MLAMRFSFILYAFFYCFISPLSVQSGLLTFIIILLETTTIFSPHVQYSELSRERSYAETTTKGCNDYASILWNCQALETACKRNGGDAQCITCVNDVCNSASITYISAMFILSVLYGVYLAKENMMSYEDYYFLPHIKFDSDALIR
ncbi:unnamed protein product [Thelazia callipaeda]|uniref:Gnk2-homologous domain-containing protein n=1 Tax=Thelazia callipaeda TaxID=103827 RepID=A0A158RCN0_THECL|nr:unnamed protein product [Thelazia callipaeda]